MSSSYYGAEVAQWSRAKRLELLRTRVARLEQDKRDEWASHQASCPRCQAGEFCLQAFARTREQSDRADKISFLRGLIGAKNKTKPMRRRRRLRLVDYRQHVDGFAGTGKSQLLGDAVRFGTVSRRRAAKWHTDMVVEGKAREGQKRAFSHDTPRSMLRQTARERRPIF